MPRRRRQRLELGATLTVAGDQRDDVRMAPRHAGDAVEKQLVLLDGGQPADGRDHRKPRPAGSARAAHRPDPRR